MRIGGSLTLIAIGAILAFAVAITPTPAAGMTIEWDTVGVILMIVGAVGLVWAMVELSAWRDRGTGVDRGVGYDRTAGYDTVERRVERDRIVER